MSTDCRAVVSTDASGGELAVGFSHAVATHREPLDEGFARSPYSWPAKAWEASGAAAITALEADGDQSGAEWRVSATA